MKHFNLYSDTIGAHGIASYINTKTFHWYLAFMMQKQLVFLTHLPLYAKLGPLHHKMTHHMLVLMASLYHNVLRVHFQLLVSYCPEMLFHSSLTTPTVHHFEAVHAKAAVQCSNLARTPYNSSVNPGIT